MSLNNPEPPTRHNLNIEEEDLRALFSHIPESSRFFRGYLIERRYIYKVNGCRDVVALQCVEEKLEKFLKDICQKYQDPSKWLGITTGNALNVNKPPGAIDTYIWTEPNNLQCGQYWFRIIDISFREHEIILELRMVRRVEFLKFLEYIFASLFILLITWVFAYFERQERSHVLAWGVALFFLLVHIQYYEEMAKIKTK